MDKEEAQNQQELELWQLYKDYMAPNAPKRHDHPMNIEFRSSYRFLGDNPGYVQVLVKKYGTQDEYEAWIRQHGDYFEQQEIVLL